MLVIIRVLVLSLLLCGISSIAGTELTWTGCGITRKAFMAEVAVAYEKETGIKITISGGGATKGIREAAAGRADLGGSCRHLMAVPEEEGVKIHPVAWDAIVVIVHPDNPVSNLTLKDLQAIFTKQKTNWKDVGGPDVPIKVFARDGKISGVGMMARELIFGDPDFEFKADERFRSSGPLEKAIMKEPYAVGLTGISSAKKRAVKVLNLNDIEPTMKYIAYGKYKLFRPLYIIAKESPTPEVKAFIDWLKSPVGQKVVLSQETVTMAMGKSLWRPYLHHMKKVKGDKKGVFD